MILQNIAQGIADFFKRWLGLEPIKTPQQKRSESKYAEDYKDNTKYNLTAIGSKKMSYYVMSDSDITVMGDNDRSKYLNDAWQRVQRKMDWAVCRTWGEGAVILKPYVIGTDIYADVIEQNRFEPLESQGEILTKAAFIDAELEIAHRLYIRLQYHTLDTLTKMYTIETVVVCDNKEVPLSAIPQWSYIPPIITISNVERMLFAIMKSPIDNKIDINYFGGVPITYGQDQIIQIISDILDAIPKEYRLKKAFVGIDETIAKDRKLPQEDLFVTFGNSDMDAKTLWQLYSPDIRHTSYFEGVNFMLSLLEKGIGADRGIYTDIEAVNTTATSILQGMYSTFALTDAMRKNIESAIDQLIYSMDVLTNAGNYAPIGDYKIKYDWSYDLRENTQERWLQLKDGVQMGVVSPVEARAWVMGMSEKEAEATLPEEKDIPPILGETGGDQNFETDTIRPERGYLQGA